MRAATENARITDTGHTLPILRRGPAPQRGGHPGTVTVTAVTLYDAVPEGLLTGIVGHAVGENEDGDEFAFPVMELVPAVGQRILLLFNADGDSVLYATAGEAP